MFRFLEIIIVRWKKIAEWFELYLERSTMTLVIFNKFALKQPINFCFKVNNLFFNILLHDRPFCLYTIFVARAVGYIYWLSDLPNGNIIHVIGQAGAQINRGKFQQAVFSIYTRDDPKIIIITGLNNKQV